MVEMDVSPSLVKRERRRAVPLGCQVEPVFARNCYTRFFRTSIENPKSARRMTREEMERLLYPGSSDYFPVADLYQGGRTSILVGPTSRVWTW